MSDEELQVSFNIDDSEQFDCVFSIDAAIFDYETLDKKPKINDVTLIGNKTSADLSLASVQDIIDLGQEITAEIDDRERADEVLQEQITANTNNFANYRTSANQDVIDATKQDVISDLSTIRSNAQAGKSASDTIATYGDIVTHNVSEFATASQGALADTALQPNDNISELNNDVGYITSSSLPTVNDGKLTIQANGVNVATFTANQSNDVTANISIPDTATWGNITGTLSNQTDLQNALDSKQPTGDYALTSQIPTDNNQLTNGAGYITSAYHDSTKQDTLTQGDNITIANNTISVSNTLSTQVAQNTEDIKSIQLFKFPNANIIGEPLVNNGNVSRFSANDYMTFPFVVDVRNKEFYIEFCYTTTSDVTTQQNIIDSYFGLAIAIQNGKWTVAASSNGTSWDIGVATGTNTIQPNTTYHVKAGWDLTTYYLDFALESEEYTRDITTSSTLGLFPATIYIGGSPNLFGTSSAHPALGTINMNHCYLYISGLLVWQGMDSAGMATRADVSLSNLDSVGQLKFDNKQDKLTAGNNINITNNVVSATVPNKTSQLTNDSNFITSSYHDSTKYDASNPNGYTSNIGTVTSVNNISPVDGNVTLNIPSAVTETTVSNWGFTKNTGTITGITMNGASKGTSGVVDLGTVITSTADCVKTNGDQTIAGTKTFSSTISGSINGNSASATKATNVNNSRDNSSLKYWTGTKAQYEAITTKDDNTLYNITDDLDITLSLLQTIYPVGCLYLTTTSTCPLASLFGTWEKVAQDRVLQGAGSRGSVGTTLSESLPNIRGSFRGQNPTSGAFSFTENGNVGGGAGSWGVINFDASRSSSTYKDGAKVQQDAYLINIYRRTT